MIHNSENRAYVDGKKYEQRRSQYAEFRAASDKQGTFTTLPSTYEYGSADRVRAMTATGHERFSLW